MKTYSVSFKYSTNEGKTWIGSRVTVKAESDQGAIMQVKSKYEYIKDIVVNSVK